MALAWRTLGRRPWLYEVPAPGMFGALAGIEG
jgi:hypothetical protein